MKFFLILALIGLVGCSDVEITIELPEQKSTLPNTNRTLYYPSCPPPRKLYPNHKKPGYLNGIDPKPLNSA